MKSLTVNVLVAFALCALAVTLMLLLAPGLSWATVLESLTSSEQAPCPFTS
jgi:hypothetical protein